MNKLIITLFAFTLSLTSIGQVKLKCASIAELEQMKNSLLEESNFEALIPIQKEIKERTESKEKIETAEAKIKAAVSIEDFALAASIKKEITHLKQAEEQRVKNCTEYHQAIKDGDYEKALLLKNQIEKNKSTQKVTVNKTVKEKEITIPEEKVNKNLEQIEINKNDQWKKLNGVRFGFSSELGAAQYVTKEDYITTESVFRYTASLGPMARLRFGNKNGFGLYFGANIGYVLETEEYADDLWFFEAHALFRYDIASKFNVLIGPQITKVLNADYEGNSPLSLKIGIGHKNTTICYSIGVTPLYNYYDSWSNTNYGGFLNTITIKTVGIFERK